MQTATAPTNLEYTETTVHPCGETHWFKLDKETGEWRLTVWFCNQHTCETCAKRKSKRQGRLVLEHLAKRPCHHLVLTVARTGRPLGQLVQHLYSSFRMLKKRPLWSKNVAGGVWFFDCAFNGTIGWGPHLHLLVEAEALSVDWLHSAWLEVTGDSWQVDASVVEETLEDRRAVAFYASKYAYKSFADNAHAMEVYRTAMKGRRKSQVFGSWYRVLRLSRKRRCPMPDQAPSSPTGTAPSGDGAIRP